MKTESSWSMIFVMTVLAMSSPTEAAGPPAQGTFFAGQGLDWQRTGTETQLFSHGISVADFPPPPGVYGVNAASIELTGCTPKSDRHALCVATVTSAPGRPGTWFCGQRLSSSKITLKLFAFNGHVLKQGVFEFQRRPPPPPPAPPPTPKEVTFACAVGDQSNIQDWEWASLGALGKCLAWPLAGGAPGFQPDSPEFTTCIRVVRADYCGNGVSHTKEGTRIDIYHPKEIITSHVVEPAFLLEANWDVDGAICILHTRFVSLPDDCQKLFPTALNVFPLKGETRGGSTVGMRGGDYWCRKARAPERACRATGPECPWLTAVQNLLMQGYLANDSLLQP